MSEPKFDHTPTWGVQQSPPLSPILPLYSGSRQPHNPLLSNDLQASKHFRGLVINAQKAIVSPNRLGLVHCAVLNFAPAANFLVSLYFPATKLGKPFSISP